MDVGGNEGVEVDDDDEDVVMDMDDRQQHMNARKNDRATGDTVHANILSEGPTMITNKNCELLLIC